MPSGPDHREAARALLEAMTAMGREEEAGRIRRGFEDRGWDLGATDIANLLASLNAPIQPDLQLDEPPEWTVENPDGDPTAPADAEGDRQSNGTIPHFVRLYRPFVEALPGWRELLATANRLLLARSWSDLRSAASEVFCDVLGFDEERVSLTSRLRGRSAVEDFELIGSFSGFKVCLVQLTRSLSDTKWSNTSEHYRPCFRLAPRAVLVSYEPGAGTIRLVYRQKHGRSDSRPRYRCIVGPWFLRDSQENLLTICRRLDLCRPELDDDAESLGRRLQAVLECEAGALAKDWGSNPVEVDRELPGLPFPDATGELMCAFLGTGEWCWGLKAHLSNLFPIPLKFGEFWLDLSEVVLAGKLATAEECWKFGRTREQRLTIRLTLRSWNSLEVLEPLEIEAALVVPDKEGWFWIEGSAFRHVPEIGPDGRILSHHTMPTWVDQLDEEDGDDSQEEDGRYPLNEAEGAIVDALLGRALERRLWMLMRYIRRKARRSCSGGEIRAWLLASVPLGEALPLVTPAMVRTLLTPVDLARPAPDLTDMVSSRDAFVGAPPAWACPDVSSTLAPDSWSVIKGARVHPTGALAVPQPAERGVILAPTGASAFDLNPRLGAPGVSGPRRWWVHPSLVPQAALDAGQLESPELMVAAGRHLDIQVVASPNTRIPQLTPGLRPPAPSMRTSLDVPKLNDVDEAPTLLVEAGQVVDAGEAWLRIPKRHLAHEFDDSDSALGEVLAGVLGVAVSGGLVERLPWDMPVRVLTVDVNEVTQLGVPMGWRAWITVAPVLRGWRVVGRDGKTLPLEDGWWPEDMPHTPDGDGFVAALPGPRGDVLCFSGLDGELLEVDMVSGLTIAPVLPGSRVSASVGVVDRLPRPGVRSMGECWSRTRLRILADGAMAPLVTALGAGALHRDVLLWAVGRADPPSDAPIEDVMEVPISSRPHRVGKVLSDSTWVASCRCGTLKGAGLLGAYCSECGEVVEPVDSVRVLRRVTLPMAVLHPWSKELAAGLLGLVPEELETLLTRHGPAPVLGACESALVNPASNARRRLQLPKGHPRGLQGQARRRLGQLTELLEHVQEPSSLAKALSVTEVGVPTLDLMKVGHTLDELTPVGSRLMVAYARLHGACWVVRQAIRMAVEPLALTAQVHLQDCVDRVFGATDATGPDTLAGLLRVVSPWSREGRPSVTTQMTPPARLPRKSAWWATRAARAQIIEHHSLDLLALVSCLPTYSKAERREAVRALARDLLDEQRDPRGLLEVLETDRDRPLQLASSWPKAQASLSERLDASLSDVSLRAVVTLLAGWWIGEPTASIQSGAVWLPPAEDGPEGLRRRVPPMSHVLWRTRPGLRAVRPELDLMAIFGVETTDFHVDVLEETEGERWQEHTRLEVTSEVSVQKKQKEASAPRPEAPVAVNTEQGLQRVEDAPMAIAEIRSIKQTLRCWLEDL